jgi:hypothetical protein
MVNTVKLGTVNMPKLLRNLNIRTRQVRDLIFKRDAIFSKDVGTKKDADGSPGAGGGRTTNLEGPAVSFGYETSTNITQADGTNQAYHVSTPELFLPGLKALQSPVVSRSGKLEESGHRITGACTFYLPSLAYIKALDNFSETTQFDEIETYDKFIDIERAVYTPSDITSTGSQTIYISQGSTYNPGYEVDRIQFKIKTADNLNSITLNGQEAGSGVALRWEATDTCTPTDWLTIDLPIRDITANDTKEVYQNGTGLTFTADPVTLDVDKLSGDSSNYLSYLQIATSSSSTIELKDINIYKSAEWRVDNIKDYRDEYMEIGALRLRGDRTSLRRANG